MTTYISTRSSIRRSNTQQETVVPRQQVGERLNVLYQAATSSFISRLSAFGIGRDNASLNTLGYSPISLKEYLDYVQEVSVEKPSEHVTISSYV